MNGRVSKRIRNLLRQKSRPTRTVKTPTGSLRNSGFKADVRKAKREYMTIPWNFRGKALPKQKGKA